MRGPRAPRQSRRSEPDGPSGPALSASGAGPARRAPSPLRTGVRRPLRPAIQRCSRGVGGAAPAAMVRPDPGTRCCTAQPLQWPMQSCRQRTVESLAAAPARGGQVHGPCRHGATPRCWRDVRRPDRRPAQRQAPTASSGRIGPRKKPSSGSPVVWPRAMRRASGRPSSGATATTSATSSRLGWLGS